MDQQFSDKNQVTQRADKADGNVTQVGGDYTNTSNINLLIPIFLFVILAGGLAWAFVVGVNKNVQKPKLEQQQPTPSSAPVTNP